MVKEHAVCKLFILLIILKIWYEAMWWSQTLEISYDVDAYLDTQGLWNVLLHPIKTISS